MQSIKWYWNRLSGMNLEEMAWRLHASGRDIADRLRFAGGMLPGARETMEREAGEIPPQYRVTDILPGAWGSATSTENERKWLSALRDRADRISMNRLTFFNQHELHLGDPVDWNRDHENDIRAPMGHAPAIDYRDFRLTGDAKFVWEPNRHHQFVVLARAYRASGDELYARAVADQVESWIARCPFGKGMNWRSPLELAIRLINWVYAIDLIRESGVFENNFRNLFMRTLYLHLWEITRKYSRGSSSNNHSIGEAAGVYVATSYFRGLANAFRWREESREILVREIRKQTFPGGCNRELALGYHVFVTQFFLVAGLTSRRVGEDFSAEYWERLESMIHYLSRMIEGGEPVYFGDADDGYVLDLEDGTKAGRIKGILSVGAVLFNRPEFKAAGGEFNETAAWLLGAEGRERFRAIPDVEREQRIVSHAYHDSGHYLLQSGHGGASDSISVLFDCGELGFRTIAAHGHADALSFTLRVSGIEILSDPGTYDYFTYREWRDYFRSTRGHNTLTVDGHDQSQMLGPFLWGKRARAKCLYWEESPEGGGKITGEHDGYTVLRDPVLHRRALALDGTTNVLEIRDEIDAIGEHEIGIHFHFSEHCRIEEKDRNIFRVGVGRMEIIFELDNRLAVTVLRASEDPKGGWISRGYHCKVPSTTLNACCRTNGKLEFRCRMFLPKE